MKRRDEYRSYLRSPEWQGQRNLALARTSSFCQFCGDFAEHVHHVRYPKRFGEEHPDSLIPVCDHCHKTSHGIQKMKALTNVQMMREFSPEGGRLNYLVSEGRVYASARSWRRALQVPESMASWFDGSLSVNALYKKGSNGDELRRSHEDVAVYRWRVVAQTLRNFDHAFVAHGFKQRPIKERLEREQFHERYERLVEWGDDLQERAMAHALNKQKAPAPASTETTTISETRLVAVVAQAVRPRLETIDGELRKQHIIIGEIKEAVPSMRDANQFIPVRQGISEMGLDPNVMPLHPKSRETLASLAGQTLVSKGAEKRGNAICRLEGQTIAMVVNKYRRGDIYAVLADIVRKTPEELPFN
jgi:hypothetical protein